MDKQDLSSFDSLLKKKAENLSLKEQGKLMQKFLSCSFDFSGGLNQTIGEAEEYIFENGEMPKRRGRKQKWLDIFVDSENTEKKQTGLKRKRDDNDDRDLLKKERNE